MLIYHVDDEIPYWEPQIPAINGVVQDFTTGWDFAVTLFKEGQTPVLTKITNIVGGPGTIQVQWVTGDLDVPPSAYIALLVGQRDADNAEFTIEDEIVIKSRG